MKFRCAELRATVFVFRGIARKLQGPHLRTSKIHLRWKPDITNTHFLKTIFILMNIFYDSIQTEQKL